ncbi:MAG: putative lipid II flippase FtsW [Bacillota bacterium]
MEVKNPDWIIFFAVVSLMGFGIIMVFSATSVTAYQSYNDSFYFLKKQVIWVAISLAVMFVLMRIDYRRWFNKSWKPIAYLAISIILLVLVLLIGTEINGARRWIRLPGVALQGSEIAKLGMVMFTAWYLDKSKDRISNFIVGLLPLLIVLGVVCALILLEPDLGTTAVIGATCFVMLFAAGARMLHLGSLVAMSLPGVIYAMLSEPYRRKRIFAFLDPWQDPQETGFHIIQSLYALGSGGLFGVGLGRSRQKFFYLPEPGTDFIFSVLGEELGLVGAAVVIGLYFLLAWRGLMIALRAQDMLGSMLAVGITTMITLQAVVNIGVVTGSLPVTGITLPFISYGGSSLVFMAVGIGILLNISRYSN